MCSIQLKPPKYFFIHILAEGQGAAFLTMRVNHDVKFSWFFFVNQKSFHAKILSIFLDFRCDYFGIQTFQL